MASGASAYRHRVTLQQAARTPDGMGGFAEAWQGIATVWAEVQPLTGKAYLAAQQVQSSVSHRVRIRYRDGVTPDMRVMFGTRHFAIDAVLCPDERKRELHLMCVERSSDG